MNRRDVLKIISLAAFCGELPKSEAIASVPSEGFWLPCGCGFVPSRANLVICQACYSEAEKTPVYRARMEGGKFLEFKLSTNPVWREEGMTVGCEFYRYMDRDFGDATFGYATVEEPIRIVGISEPYVFKDWLPIGFTFHPDGTTTFVDGRKP